MAKPREKGRAARQAQALAEAALVHVPDQVDVCVVGGGASGLVAATVAGEAGARVVVLETSAECGRTILATGNGRCNFANADLDAAVYNEPEFVGAVCGGNWLDDILGFFRGCGMAWTREAQGRLYPISRQAASVRSVVLQRARRAGAVLAPAREVRSVRAGRHGYTVAYRELFGKACEREFFAKSVVWATGGGRVPAGLKLRANPAEPVLCPLACEGLGLEELDGRRAQACLTLMRDGQTVLQEAGEVLFRPWGISGIVTFDLSRYARPADEVRVDLLFGVAQGAEVSLGLYTLDGLLDPSIARILVREANDPLRAVTLARNLRYTVTGLAETSRAQVTRGGLVVSQFDPATLEAYTQPGFFACGETLDVDGPCGGYNLAWAWKSGMVAGAAAV